MILDYLTRVERYKGVSERLVAAIRFAESLSTCAVGRYEMGECFAMVQEFETKLPCDNTFELHRKYLDVHIVLEGVEVLEYEDISKLTATQSFNEDNDKQKLAGTGQPVIIRPGMFCLVFPHDGHKPGCCLDTPDTLRKIVLKVPV